MTIRYPIHAEFESFRKIADSKERDKIRKDIENPDILTGIDGLRAFYEEMGLEFDEEIFEKIIGDCSSHFQSGINQH